MARAASRPSMPGILMSRMARSGRSVRASSTASSPRPVSPTISYPSSSRVSRRSRRMMASSSAISTRVGNDVSFPAAPFNHPRVVGRSAGDEPVEELVLRASSPAMVSTTSARRRLMASAWRRASRCSRSASGVSETRDRRWASSASSARWMSCSSMIRSSSRSARRRSLTSARRRSTNDRCTGGSYGWVDGGASAGRVGYESPMSDAWSITDGYWDTGGAWHPTTDAARRALLVAMGADERSGPPPPPPMWFLEAGSAATLAGPCDLVLEDGTTLPNLHALPPDLPLGYHDLHPQAGGPTTRLVITPRRCPLPERAWGWAVQLYALRSAASWGIGDLVDLRAAGRLVARPRRRHRDDQPAPRRRAGPAAAAEPLLPDRPGCGATSSTSASRSFPGAETAPATSTRPGGRSTPPTASTATPSIASRSTP